jgi:hypothetical protein
LHLDLAQGQRGFQMQRTSPSFPLRLSASRAAFSAAGLTSRRLQSAAERLAALRQSQDVPRAVLSLAIGISASAAIFSLIDAVLLKAFSVQDPQELALLQWSSRVGRRNQLSD